MKCHILFSGKNKKNILKCRLLKILPRVLSVNTVIIKLEMCVCKTLYACPYKMPKLKGGIALTKFIHFFFQKLIR